MAVDSESTFRIQARANANTSDKGHDTPSRAERGPGTLAGEYVLKAMLAAGGHGSVYEAEHRILGRHAAVKVLHSHLADQGEMLQRFVREARVVNQIHHPNIVDVYDFGLMPDGSPYYVMELLSGRTLSQVVQERGRLSASRALAYLEPVCGALEAAHRAGVVHRDLKSSNILVVEEGEKPRLKLLDFGIAKLIQQEPGQEGLTTAGQRLGTAHAMAPEQFRGGTIGPPTDVYALGVLLYQLLTGRYPFQSDDRLELERMHLEAPPPRPSVKAPVSPAVDAVVLRCLDKDATRRYPSVNAFLTALREATEEPNQVESQTRLVLAVNAEVVLPATDMDDDTTYAALAHVMDTLEQGLRAEHFILALQTGTALLGVRPVAAGITPALALQPLRELQAEAQRLAEAVHARVHLCLHHGEAETRGDSGEAEVVGGPVTHVATWNVRDPGGFAITRPASQYLEAPPPQ
ncbi:serine/threonine protein kinase [Corallococcus exiguus]|uniref:serine/threonine-protein kinase n=1 Tax=Corallococcus TaxID=83461 RepID=UPI000EE677A8|nr:MULTISPECIES: serine/threonine-protein kinase [Corallococcus]NNB84204.1 serine/threonine protein kinase [Corallococcus exiguus]NNC00228.1 serine/threonine protein kinase [Corallococcus exiguus]NNC08602.1 serine/threonine protein kinase [Corallococcus exiguus]NPC51140.1 serine/threonine protein kinase [Corallococcus exiguus]RKH87064.1 serine/threonine protein kinase [Corallococcus sp. AB032C]